MKAPLRILAGAGGILLVALVVGAILIATWPPFGRWLLGLETVRAGVAPFPQAAPNFDHALLDKLLDERVRGGHVDYTALAADSSALRRYVATLEVTGPRTTPGRFPTEAHRTAWTINAYNAAVLLGVVHHWPIRSVHDVRGAVEPKAGFGFFWAQRFVLDGESTHLMGLEGALLRRTRDARIHGALNCASLGCPDLRSAAWSAEDLDARLDEAATRLASEPRHVQVDDAARAIVLSQIYEWYAADFANDARARGWGVEVLDWVANFAEPDVAQALAQARQAGYVVAYRPYDWGLNGE
ncbi:MAG: DUF547 domain-containing protein [Myxococcota bacterium]